MHLKQSWTFVELTINLPWSMSQKWFKYVLHRKQNWKSCLQNGCQFIQASMCQTDPSWIMVSLTRSSIIKALNTVFSTTHKKDPSISFNVCHIEYHVNLSAHSLNSVKKSLCVDSMHWESVMRGYLFLFHTKKVIFFQWEGQIREIKKKGPWNFEQDKILHVFISNCLFVVPHIWIVMHKCVWL